MNLQRPMIEGYIQHRSPKFYLDDEAFYWLALLFDFHLFLKCFGHVGHVSRKITLLVILGTFIFRVRMLRSELRYRAWKWRDARRPFTPDDDIPF